MALIQAQQVETVKESENISYAEAVRKVRAPRGSDHQRSLFNAIGPKEGSEVPDNLLVVDKTAFFAFLVEILWAVRQVKTSSDIKAIIAKEAMRFLEVEVLPEHLNISNARKGAKGNQIGGGSSPG